MQLKFISNFVLLHYANSLLKCYCYDPMSLI